MGNIKTNYKCAQKDLYTVAKMGWANYAQYQTDLAAYKALYTPAYGVGALSEVEAAQALPDNEARGAISETERIELVELGNVCLKYMQYAKGYIETAYTNQAMWKPQFEAIGMNYYTDASNGDWESMVMMNQSASTYLNDTVNVSKLTAGQNMPNDFMITFDAAALAFSTKYSDFLSSKDTSTETESKIEANNLVHKKLTDMFRDAQRVFSDDVVVLGKFTFQTLLDSINPPVAGVRGTVKEAVTNMPIAATIQAQKAGEVAVEIVCGADGSFSQQLSEGEYNLKVNAVGYVAQVMDLNLKLTGLKRMDIVMVKTV